MIKKLKKLLSRTDSGITNSMRPYNDVPPPGKVNLGDLNRTTPISKEFGFDRGGPVDRYYISRFLQQEAAYVRGRVLEIGDNSYTKAYGGENVQKSDILHVDDSNASATFVGDLSDAPHLPDNAFDCIILTQTLHLIYEYKNALNTCHRILKPGGALLLTVPGISHIDYNDWGTNWYWSFTDRAMKKLMSETFPGGNASVETYGNVLTAAAFLYGLSEIELNRLQLDPHDPNMQLIVAVRALKKD